MINILHAEKFKNSINNLQKKNSATKNSIKNTMNEMVIPELNSRNMLDK